MSRQSRFSRRVLTAFAAASLVTAMGLTALPAAADAGTPPGAGPSADAGVAVAKPAPLANRDALSGLATAKVAALAHATGRQTVFVQLKGTGGASTFNAAYKS